MKNWIVHVKKLHIVFLVALTVCLIMPQTVFASSGWFSFDEHNSYAQEKLYGDGTVNAPEEGEEPAEEEKVGSLEKNAATMVYNAFKWLNDNFLCTKYFDFSIDGVIMGRMSQNCPTTASGVRVAYSQFTLSYGNPWGIMGAIIFVVLRSLMYALFIYYFLIKLGVIGTAGSKKKLELKELFTSVAFFMLLMYCLPYVIDWTIYVLDSVRYMINKTFRSYLLLGDASAGVSTSILDTWGAYFEQSPSIMNALLYSATVFSGVFYLQNYIGTALIQVFLFGTIPYICFSSLWDKKSFQDWGATFFSNLLIPLVDSILFIVPIAFVAIFNENTGGAALPSSVSTNSSFAATCTVTIIQLILIFAILPSRNLILRAINARFNAPAPKSGMGGLMAFGAMALRGLMGRRGGGSSSREDSGGKDSGTSIPEEEANQEVLNDANDSLRRNSSSDMHDIFGEEDSEVGEKGLDEDDYSLNGESDPVDDVLNDESEVMTGFDEEGEAIGSGNESDWDPLDDEEETILDSDVESLPSGDDVEGLDEEPDVDSLADVPSNADSIDVETDSEAELEGGAEEELRSGEQPILDENGEPVEDLSGNMATVDPSTTNSGVPDEYYDIPGIDQETLDSMSGSARDRYANLAAKDAMEQELQRNDEELASVRTSMADNNVRIADEREAISDINSDTSELRATNTSLEGELASNNASIMENNSKIAENNRAMAAIHNVDISQEQGTIDYANSSIASQRMDIADRTYQIAQNNQKISSLDKVKDASEISSLRAENNNLQTLNHASQQKIASFEYDKSVAQGTINSKVGNSAESIRMRNENASLDSDNARIVSANSKIQTDIQKNNQKIAENNAKVASHERNIASMNSDNERSQKTLTKIQERNTKLSNGIENASKRENEYASNAKAVGMDGTVYKNAGSFATKQKAVENMKKQINYKNFDSKKYEGLLTPQERADYARSRALHDNFAKAGHVAGTVVKGAVAVGAAVTAAYGGPNAMAVTGAGTYMAAGATGKATKKVVEGASSYGKAVAEQVDTIKKTKNGKIIKAASSFNPNNPYQGSVKKKPQKTTSPSQTNKADQFSEESIRKAKQEFLNDVNRSNLLK